MVLGKSHRNCLRSTSLPRRVKMGEEILFQLSYPGILVHKIKKEKIDTQSVEKEY